MAIMSVLILIILGALLVAVSNLSAVRAYVNGEALWSKSQKDAVFYLTSYANHGDEQNYRRYLHQLSIPKGDRIARIELEKIKPDLSIARKGFIQGRNHPDDINGMIRIFRQFRKLSYIDKAVRIWTDADPFLVQLETTGNQIHELVKSGKSSPELMSPLMRQLGKINYDLTLLEDEFSYTLGEASRWLEGLVLKLLLALIFMAELLGILISVTVGKNIISGVKELLRGTKQVIKGNLYTRVHVDSQDEMEELARHFNLMTSTMQQKIADLKLIEERLIKEKERAENSERAKRIFLTNMSHEIRTPMNGILGFARLLESSDLNTEQLEYVQTILKSGDNLLVILNDILDLSKIEAGKLVLEKTNFNPVHVVESSINMVRPMCQDKGLSLNCFIDEEMPEFVEGDPVRLGQILNNLLSNAVKFTERGGVTCKIEPVKVYEKVVEIQFSIEDSGIGIPFDLQEKVFQSFEQASSDTTRKFGGTGLGLSIVKQLVEIQGGKIWLKSKPGKGSEFIFKIPYVEKSITRKRANISNDDAEGPQRILKILVVEDNHVNQLLATRVLEKFGFLVDIAGNGVEAIKKLENDLDFDLIIMDIQMPEMDGYQATRHIRSSHSKYRDIPIIAMTAHTIVGELEKCIEAGMTDFISKPFNPTELKKKITSLMEKI